MQIVRDNEKHLINHIHDEKYRYTVSMLVLKLVMVLAWSISIAHPCEDWSLGWPNILHKFLIQRPVLLVFTQHVIYLATLILWLLSRLLMLLLLLQYMLLLHLHLTDGIEFVNYQCILIVYYLHILSVGRLPSLLHTWLLFAALSGIFVSTWVLLLLLLLEELLLEHLILEMERVLLKTLREAWFAVFELLERGVLKKTWVTVFLAVKISSARLSLTSLMLVGLLVKAEDLAGTLASLSVMRAWGYLTSQMLLLRRVPSTLVWRHSLSLRSWWWLFGLLDTRVLLAIEDHTSWGANLGLLLIAWRGF